MIPFIPVRTSPWPGTKFLFARRGRLCRVYRQYPPDVGEALTTPEFPTGSGQPQAEEVGFFAAMFDFDFETFVALRFIKVIYIIALVFIGLGAVGVFFVSIANGQFLTAILALVFLFFYLIIVRVWLEVIAVLFRIGDNTTAIREMLDKGTPRS
jgi:Domain of unknown function (DUF4282)